MSSLQHWHGHVLSIGSARFLGHFPPLTMFKCSRNYRVKPTPPSWLSEAGLRNRCTRGMWYNVCPDLNAKPQKGETCECKKNQRSLSCEHYICKQCCLRRGETDVGHDCRLRDHRPLTMSRSSPVMTTPTTSPSRPTPSGLAPFTTPTRIPSFPAGPSLPLPTPTVQLAHVNHPFHAHNVSGYILQNPLPPQYVQNSLLNKHVSPVSFARDAREINNKLVVGWCKTANVLQVDMEINVPAPLPNFIPSRSEALIEFTGVTAENLKYYSIVQNGRWVGQSTGLTKLRPDYRILLGPAALAGHYCVPELIQSFSPSDTSAPSSPLKRADRHTELGTSLARSLEMHQTKHWFALQLTN
ncbi:hypothetical protein GGX14DRAFT_620118, partial [Mycena pura]